MTANPTGAPKPQAPAMRARPKFDAKPAEPTAKEVVDLAKQLHVQTERMNAQFEAVTEAFRGSGLTVSASVELEEGPLDGGTPQWWHIAYEKHDGTWGLWIRLVSEPPPDVDEPGLWIRNRTPILRANRRLRVKAALMLPKLYAELVKELRDQLDEVTLAVATLERFVDLPIGAPLPEADDNDDEIPF